MRVGSVWYSRGSTVSPSDIPVSLIDLTLTEGGAQQTFVIGDQYFYAVAVYTRSGLYVELFPLSDLLETLRNGALLLVLLALERSWSVERSDAMSAGLLMRPLRRMGAGARRLAAGDLSCPAARHRRPGPGPDLGLVQ